MLKFGFGVAWSSIEKHWSTHAPIQPNNPLYDCIAAQRMFPDSFTITNGIGTSIDMPWRMWVAGSMYLSCVKSTISFLSSARLSQSLYGPTICFFSKCTLQLLLFEWSPYKSPIIAVAVILAKLKKPSKDQTLPTNQLGRLCHILLMQKRYQLINPSPPRPPRKMSQKNPTVQCFVQMWQTDFMFVMFAVLLVTCK